MKPGECAAFDGLRLAELIAKKKTTPRELGACVLAGVAKLNPQLNAVVEMYDDAVEALGEEPGSKETFTALFNATGSPALSLPIAWTDAGLPIGIQFVAQFGREDVLLPLARVPSKTASGNIGGGSCFQNVRRCKAQPPRRQYEPHKHQ
jgi:Asp-tRNA(Asn)/Glu-tRNA(Gln) amidotransferase A subunit family amidase